MPKNQAHHFTRQPGRYPAGNMMDVQPNFDESLRRQREVFADRYADNPELQRYADEMDGMAFDGIAQADLPDYDPDSFNYAGE
jgi:hypothetical protein